MANIQGHLPPWGERELSDAQRKQAKAALSRCLGSDHISTRQGPRNTRIPYLDVSTTIRLANEAFRYDGWSSNIISITQDFIQEERGTWSCCYTALVRITLPNGCYHEGIGVGNAENTRLQADAIEKAKKSAVSDAMKRALRCFGEGLGNNITSDSATSRGSVLSIYEDEFDVKENPDQAIAVSKDIVATTSTAISTVAPLNNSKRLHTTVSPVVSGQFNLTNAITTSSAAPQPSVVDALSNANEIDTIGDLTAQPCNAKPEVNINVENKASLSNKILVEKPSLFQIAATRKPIEQYPGQCDRKALHMTTPDGKQEKTLPSEPSLKQSHPMFSKARHSIFSK